MTENNYHHDISSTALIMGSVVFLLLFVIDCIYSKYHGIHYLFHDMKTCIPYLLLSLSFGILESMGSVSKKNDCERVDLIGAGLCRF